MKFVALITLGLTSGVLSGIAGIGGGAVILPALIYAFGYPINLAQGTMLAMLVPLLGLVVTWACFKSGYVEIPTAIAIAIGFVIGSYMATRAAYRLPLIAVRKIYSLTLAIVALQMFFNFPQS
jgi:uncharacterized protein